MNIVQIIYYVIKERPIVFFELDELGICPIFKIGNYETVLN